MIVSLIFNEQVDPTTAWLTTSTLVNYPITAENHHLLQQALEAEIAEYGGAELLLTGVRPPPYNPISMIEKSSLRQLPQRSASASSSGKTRLVASLDLLAGLGLKL